jgi:hypothetical protein
VQAVPQASSQQSDQIAALTPLAQQLNIAAAQIDDYGVNLMKLLAS